MVSTYYPKDARGTDEILNASALTPYFPQGLYGSASAPTTSKTNKPCDKTRHKQRESRMVKEWVSQTRENSIIFIPFGQIIPSTEWKIEHN